jgi:hypothetical protein
MAPSSGKACKTVIFAFKWDLLLTVLNLRRRRARRLLLVCFGALSQRYRD